MENKWVEYATTLKEMAAACEDLKSGNTEIAETLNSKVRGYAIRCLDIFRDVSEELTQMIEPQTYISLMNVFQLFLNDILIERACLEITASLTVKCYLPESFRDFIGDDLADLAECFSQYTGEDLLSIRMEDACIAIADVIIQNYTHCKLKYYSVHCLTRLACALVKWAPSERSNPRIKLATTNIGYSILKFNQIKYNDVNGCQPILADVFTKWFKDHSKSMGVARKMLKYITEYVINRYELDELATVTPEDLAQMCNSFSKWSEERRHGPMRSATIVIAKFVYTHWKNHELDGFTEDVLYLLVISFSKWHRKDNQQRSIKLGVISLACTILTYYQKNILGKYRFIQLVNLVIHFTKWAVREDEVNQLKRVVLACAYCIGHRNQDFFKELSFSSLVHLMRAVSVWKNEDDEQGTIFKVALAVAKVVNFSFQYASKEIFEAHELPVLAKAFCVWRDKDHNFFFECNVKFIASLISARFYKTILSEYKPNCLCSFAEAFSTWYEDKGVIKTGILVIATVITRLNLFGNLIKFNRTNLSGIAMEFSKWTKNEDRNRSVRLATHSIAKTTYSMKLYDKLKKFKGIHLSELASAFTKWIKCDNKEKSLRNAIEAIAQTVEVHKFLDREHILRYKPTYTIRLLETFLKWYRVRDETDVVWLAILYLMESVNLYMNDTEIDSFSLHDLCALVYAYNEVASQNSLEEKILPIIKCILVKYRRELLLCEKLELIYLVEVYGSLSKCEDEDGELRTGLRFLATVMYCRLADESCKIVFTLEELVIIIKSLYEWHTNEVHTSALMVDIGKYIVFQKNNKLMDRYGLWALAKLVQALSAWPPVLIVNPMAEIADMIDSKKLWSNKSTSNDTRNNAYDKSVLHDLLHALSRVINASSNMLSMDRIVFAFARIINAHKWQDLHAMKLGNLNNFKDILVKYLKDTNINSTRVEIGQHEIKEAVSYIRRMKYVKFEEHRDFRKITIQTAYELLKHKDNIKLLERKHICDTACCFSMFKPNDDGWLYIKQGITLIGEAINSYSDDDLKKFSQEELKRLLLSFTKLNVNESVRNAKLSIEGVLRNAQ